MEPPHRAPRGNRKPAGPAGPLSILPALTLFGFVQLDFPGTLALADGRYVVREGNDEEVLVVRTLSAPPPPRRRRRVRSAEPGAEPAALPLTRATVVHASKPFDDEDAASAWLTRAVDSDEVIEEAIGHALTLLDRALHANAAASGAGKAQTVSAERAAVARLGFGSGEEVADGAFSRAREVDPRAGSPRRRQRTEELRPQERVAAVLAGRERIDACETLILRARADLDAGRDREAALQLRVALDALLVELAGALDDPGHAEDMAMLQARRNGVAVIADAALRDGLDPKQLTEVSGLVALCERVLRRRRVLRG